MGTKDTSYSLLGFLHKITGKTNLLLWEDDCEWNKIWETNVISGIMNIQAKVSNEQLDAQNRETQEKAGFKNVN